MPRGLGCAKGQKTVLDDDGPGHRGGSRYASCLIPKERRRHPAQTAQLKVLSCLHDDEQHFKAKYEVRNIAATGSDPESRYAKYSIKMPKGPIHNKFSMTEVSRASDDTVERRRPKFCVATLRRWFASID